MDTVDLNSGGAPTEYHSVDIDSLLSGNGVVSEPQLMPTASLSETTPDDLSFVSVTTKSNGTGNREQVEGNVSPTQTLSDDELGYMRSEPRQPQGKGRTSQFLESKGFGWLLEAEEEDAEENNRPLLLVFLTFYPPGSYVSAVTSAAAIREHKPRTQWAFLLNKDLPQGRVLWSVF